MLIMTLLSFIQFYCSRVKLYWRSDHVLRFSYGGVGGLLVNSTDCRGQYLQISIILQDGESFNGDGD